ncbi:MAG: DUF4202 domain-containing protein [Myxococcota bacterium]|nr:DUF4202 domain-containing protein [Myxococcota bacterium]
MADRLQAAIDAIDAENAADPKRIEIRGEKRPKELAHAVLASDWVRKLDPEASDPLLLAARAHHLRRWEVPREDYPDGKAGYHRWRRELQKRHAGHVGRILLEQGYDESTIGRVQSIVRKQGLGSDPEVQVFEDALCLVFIETQFRELADRLGDDKLVDITRKTVAKMSDAGIARVRELSLSDEDMALIERALSQ